MPQSKNTDVELVQIGTLANRVGLSLRTVRYYEEIGLIEPAERSQGGFRLYGPQQEARLQVLKAMKPLGFSLDEMHGLVNLLDEAGLAKAGTKKAHALDERVAAMQEEINQRRVNLIKQIDASAQISSALKSVRENLQ